MNLFRNPSYLISIAFSLGKIFREKESNISIASALDISSSLFLGHRVRAWKVRYMCLLSQKIIPIVKGNSLHSIGRSWYTTHSFLTHFGQMSSDEILYNPTSWCTFSSFLWSKKCCLYSDSVSLSPESFVQHGWPNSQSKHRLLKAFSMISSLSSRGPRYGKRPQAHNHQFHMWMIKL